MTINWQEFTPIASLIGAGIAKKNPLDPFSNPAS
jgi:hypothetical protein